MRTRHIKFLSNFAKLLKATISFVISFRLSVRMEQLGSHYTDFHETWYKNFSKIQVSLKSYKNITGILHEDQYTFFLIISCSVLLGMRE